MTPDHRAHVAAVYRKEAAARPHQPAFAAWLERAAERVLQAPGPPQMEMDL